MADESSEVVSVKDVKGPSALDNCHVESDLSQSGNNKVVDNTPEEPVIDVETVPKETNLNDEFGSIHDKSTDVPCVDIEALKELENKAVEVDRNLHRMMDNISRKMNGISTTSVRHAECYKECVKNVGNVTDTATKAMAKLIGKCEEMNKNMEPLYSMAEQVKTINRLLDQFEEKCK